MRSSQLGALYFATVFGAGFMLGAIRTWWIVPRLGDRTAGLLEAPFMLAVTIVAARSIILRFAVPNEPLGRLGMGLVGLVLLIAAEFGLVAWVRKIPLKQYLATRDPISGTVYYILLGAFAIMPLLVLRR